MQSIYSLTDFVSFGYCPTHFYKTVRIRRHPAVISEPIRFSREISLFIQCNLCFDPKKILKGIVTNHKINGEPATRCILECILRRKLGKITVMPQHFLQGEDTDRHGIRMDVYLDEEDGAKTVFLYTKGTKGNPPEDLRQLLCYMEHSLEENAGTEALQKLHEMVTAVKKDGTVGLAYMKSFEIEARIRKEALAEGRKEGKQRTFSPCLATWAKSRQPYRKRLWLKKNADTLRTWLKYAARAENMEDFMKRISG